MTKKTEELAKRIEAAKDERVEKVFVKPQMGPQLAYDMLTNMFGCVLMGTALGVLFQNLFHTPAALTAGLTFFGFIVGLFQIVRQAMSYERKGK